MTLLDKTKEKKQCSKCGKTFGVENFYTTSRTDLYPNGRLDECKKCFTMHINIYDPSTFLNLLEKVDVPYIESEWVNIVEKYGKNPKTTATAIFGRYLAKMKLKQYSQFSYNDTSRFIEEAQMAEIKKKAAKLDQINKYRDAQNSGALYNNLETLELEGLTEEEKAELFPNPEELIATEEYHKDEDDLTKADKDYLINKWGRTYDIDECIKLERLYIGMTNSYDIETASHNDYLLKICRISLKIDQALEVNDIDGYQKMSKIYDLLMKSAKFTAAQNKGVAEDYTDSIGVLIAMAEKEGFVPKYITEREDVVDITLNDMNSYLRKLVMDEMNLGGMIEIYLEKMKANEENSGDEVLEEDEDDDIIILTPKEEKILEDDDFVKYNEMLEEGQEIDEETIRKSGGR